MIESSDNNNSFTKTICSICYEDLKPIVEDLQSISVCGHVFHELCLQQWFEYCSSTKKCTCPVCKQGCKAKDASRLYFQSIGDSVATDPSLTQRLQNHVRDEDPEALRREVKRLEIKMVGLDSIVERQDKELKDVNEELCRRKEFEKKETSLKNEALKEKVLVQQLLRAKTEALDKSTLECLRLKERSMGLAKELASIKLVSDFELEEDEIMKLASFGNGDKSQDTIDILRKSLVMRNKSYKELMVKCNALGRGESRSTQKLEKAKEKISRLKERVKELEIAAETKENDVLRGLRASKKTCREGANTNLTHKKLPESQSEEGFGPRHLFDLSKSSQDDLSGSLGVRNSKVANDYNVHDIQVDPKAIAQNKEKKTGSLIGAYLSESLTNAHVLPNFDLKLETTEDIIILELPNESSNLKNGLSVGHRNTPTGAFSTRTNTDNASETCVIDIDDDVIELQENAAQVKPVLNIRKEPSTSQPFSNPGDACFSGGLVGPDGTSRYLGKWCKRSQNKETRHDGNADLISVGPDGRGGTVKVLRSRNQSSTSMDSKSKEALVGTKRLKLGGKSNSQQSRGCLQIEHFFGRATN